MEEMKENNCTCENDGCCSNHECESHEEKPLKEKRKDKKKKDEINNLKNLIKELEEKNMRVQAELINYRKRKDEEVSKMLKYANEDLVIEMLSTIDNFERAIELDDENMEDELSRFLTGFKLIYCNLKSVLEKYGVKAIDGNNKPFDPTYHQAVMTDHIDGMEPGMVIDVLQKGYLLKDKVIRPAMVKVSE